MATSILTHETRQRPPLAALIQLLRLASAELSARRAHRQATARIRRLGPRLAADMGIDLDPADGWDALRPNSLLVPRQL